MNRERDIDEIFFHVNCQVLTNAFWFFPIFSLTVELNEKFNGSMNINDRSDSENSDDEDVVEQSIIDADVDDELDSDEELNGTQADFRGGISTPLLSVFESHTPSGRPIGKCHSDHSIL